MHAIISQKLFDFSGRLGYNLYCLYLDNLHFPCPRRSSGWGFLVEQQKPKMYTYASV
jgi:hypothetical protein